MRASDRHGHEHKRYTCSAVTVPQREASADVGYYTGEHPIHDSKLRQSCGPLYLRSKGEVMKRWVLLLSLLFAVPGFAQRLAEDQGVELRGSIVVEAYAVGECNINEANHTEEEYERIRVNQDKPMDVYRAEFSVYNGSGRALDHLIANYAIASEWPDCTNWTSGDYTNSHWADTTGFIQATATPYSVAPRETLTDTKYIIVLAGDPAPRFEDWRFTFNFADVPADSVPPAQSSPVVGGNSSAQAPASTSQTSGTPGLRPEGITAADTCEGRDVGTACWMETGNLPGCYLWNPNLQRNDAAEWSGECSGGLIEGTGDLRWAFDDNEGTRQWNESSGQMSGGKSLLSQQCRIESI